MNPALLILNPREIPECIEALNALDIPKCWISYMNEPEAARAANRAIRDTAFSHYVLISDDAVPTQEALDLVLDQASYYPVVTGYCNLDQSEYRGIVNLTTNLLPPPPPTQGSYHFKTRLQVEAHRATVIPTTFAGLAFTCAHRRLWDRFPLQTDPTYGGQMDYNLSYRLAQKGIPIVAAVGAYVEHVKERWDEQDQNPQKRLLIGERSAEVRWDHVPYAEALV